MPDILRYHNDTLELGFSPADGALCDLSLAGDAARYAGVVPTVAGIDARLGHGDWLSERHRAWLESHQAATRADGALEIALTVCQGPLRYVDTYLVRGRLIARTIRVENAGNAEVQLNGVRLTVPAVRMGYVAECKFEAPATNVRPHVSLAVAAEERLDEPPSALFAPSARDRWDRAL